MNTDREAGWPTDGLEAVGACPLCGAPERTLLHGGLRDRIFHCAPGEWTLYRCGGCGCGYLDPRPSPETVHLAYTAYFTHEGAGARSWRQSLRALGKRLAMPLMNGYRNWRFGTRFRPAPRIGILLGYLGPTARYILDRAVRFLPRQAADCRLLDLGFGGGGFLDLMRCSGWRVCGADPDPVVIEAARARGLEVRLGGAEAYADQPDSFDVVTLSHVIEHLHDPRAALLAIRRLLKPGGLLWIDTPNLAGPGHAHFAADWLGLDAPRHLVLYTPDSLKGLLADLGFEAIADIPDTGVTEGWYRSSLAVAAGADDPMNPGTAALPAPDAARLRQWIEAAARIPAARDNIALICRRPRG